MANDRLIDSMLGKLIVSQRNSPSNLIDQLFPRKSTICRPLISRIALMLRLLLVHCSYLLKLAKLRGAVRQVSTARIERAPSECARSASTETCLATPLCHHTSLFFSNSFTFPGFAFPPLTFITCPTRNPSTCCFPSLNCATCAGFFASTSSTILSSAPSSDT